MKKKISVIIVPILDSFSFLDSTMDCYSLEKIVISDDYNLPKKIKKNYFISGKTNYHKNLVWNKVLHHFNDDEGLILHEKYSTALSKLNFRALDLKNYMWYKQVVVPGHMYTQSCVDIQKKEDFDKFKRDSTLFITLLSKRLGLNLPFEGIEKSLNYMSFRNMKNIYPVLTESIYFI